VIAIERALEITQARADLREHADELVAPFTFGRQRAAELVGKPKRCIRGAAKRLSLGPLSLKLGSELFELGSIPAGLLGRELGRGIGALHLRLNLVEPGVGFVEIALELVGALRPFTRELKIGL
jgi:hypothetical protein